MNENTVEILQNIFFCYLNPSLNIFGFALGLLSYIIFLNDKFTTNFYNYKRVEILFSWLSLYFYTLRFFYYCGGLNTKLSSLIIQLINRYFRDVFEMTSMQCCVLSSMYFYLKLIQLAKFRKI